MRKRLVGVLLVGFVVAGCGSSESGSPEAGAPAPQPAPQPTEPARNAPAKVTDVADKCGILSPEQQQELGVSNPPEEDESNGKRGCQYQQGELGKPGWNAFVAVDGKSSFDKEVKKHSSNLEKAELSGYPVAKYRESTGCVLYANVADRGFLITNVGQNSATDAPVDLCQQAEKVTEMALENIPNA